MSEFEKSLGALPPTADNLPSKSEHRKLSSDDADTSEETEDKSETEKAGGLKDYFVSGTVERRHLN